MTLDFSTTGHAIDPTWGYDVKTSDNTCTVVGMCYVTNGIDTLGKITPGSGYTNGTYYNVPLTGGSGFWAYATVVVSDGRVTSVTPTTGGGHYILGDTLSVAAANIGGTGSSFSVPVSSVAIGLLGSAAAQNVVSYHNRLRYYIASPISGSNSTTTLKNISGRLECVNWSDDMPVGPILFANINDNKPGNSMTLGVSLNGSQNWLTGAGYNNPELMCCGNQPGGDGWNYWEPMLKDGGENGAGEAWVITGSMKIEGMAV